MGWLTWRGDLRISNHIVPKVLPKSPSCITMATDTNGSTTTKTAAATSKVDGDNNTATSHHTHTVTAATTHHQPPQLVYMQANASPSTSVCRHAADAPPTTPTRPYASKRVPSDTSASALRQTRPWPRQQVRKQAKRVPSHASASTCRQTYTNASASALHREYFFSICFVSLTMCFPAHSHCPPCPII